MRLLVITNDFPPKPGGIQTYLGSLLDAYPGPVRVLAPADGPAIGTSRGEEIVRRGKRRFMWPTKSVVDWFIEEARDFEPDAIFFGAPHPLTRATTRLKEELGIPVGILCHGAEVTIPAASPGVRSWLRRTLRSADVLFAVSRFTQNKVSRLTGCDVVAIGAGVEVDTFTPADSPPDNTPPVVGCVSRFVPRKGQQRVIAAAKELKEQGIDVEVLIVGKGRTEAKLRKLAADSGVAVRFEIDVPWKDLAGLYRSMDVFCMPCRSRWGGLEIEGLGLVFLEAAAAGLPVLAGSSGGSPETVLPGETGFVVDSVSDIVEGLDIILADPERARQMGAKGRLRVVDEYVWDRVVSDLEYGFRS
ncbi:MAG: glycosyltransferase family 4 protein [Acidimicrobiia bacterium]|nr:glycosyltransferase family 4 protein [Acidimicrobiia bacterium]MDX2467629.1 glycosyltransferase family 4 protein [Acidimicrobiia bacterium]